MWYVVAMEAMEREEKGLGGREGGRGFDSGRVGSSGGRGRGGVGGKVLKGEGKSFV